ncbi:hypothetical protein PHYPSEUDO_008551 [Phytophthora pseudosyringae]|uniref:Transmembrane protein n=1 Tax=Phytophthora pseudosyringae TaxID=221518 RepID=A0A8T1VER3_9STRA|nr:hypothetical protein PHYPSEUDO_008551 [Phytophthora pseudosyringae]
MLFFALLALVTAVLSTELDANGVAVANSQAGGSLVDVDILVQEEARVVNTLMELDVQLDDVLDRLSSASEAVEIDVVVGGASGSNIADEIVVEFPAAFAATGPKLSDEERDAIKGTIEQEVADTLDAMLIVPEEVELDGGSLSNKVERLFEEEAEAEQQLDQMKQELREALDTLPSDGPSAEIDIVVSETDGENEQEVVDDEITVVVPASTGSGPRLTEEEKQELEEEVETEAADALGEIIMDNFMDDQGPDTTDVVDLQVPSAPRLQEDSPREKTRAERTSAPFADEKAVQAAWEDTADEPEPKPGLRGATATSALTKFVPHHWQMPPDEQLWTMKLSMLTSMTCLTLLLIVGVWTGVRRSRRRAVLDDDHFRWAAAVEYMDAFPFDR